MKEISEAFKNFLQIALNRLGELTIFNLIVLFGVFLFCAFDGISNGVSLIIYSIGDVISQVFFNKHITKYIDGTPFIIYVLFIGIGALICFFIIDRFKKGKLW